jgi:uridine phosphorylase
MGARQMETAHLLHLALSWPRSAAHPAPAGPPPPVPDAPGHPTLSGASAPPAAAAAARRHGSIRAAAVHMVFAARGSNAFITPAGVLAAEDWAGRGVLDALVEFGLDGDVRASGTGSAELTGLCFQKLHEEKGSVWELK